MNRCEVLSAEKQVFCFLQNRGGSRRGGGGRLVLRLSWSPRSRSRSLGRLEGARAEVRGRRCAGGSRARGRAAPSLRGAAAARWHHGGAWAPPAGGAGGTKGLKSWRCRRRGSSGKPTGVHGGGSGRGLRSPAPRRAGARPIGRRARRARSQATWREARRPAAPDAPLRPGGRRARAARGPAARR